MPPFRALPPNNVLALLLASSCVSALEPTRGHGELECAYNTASQSWNWEVSWVDDDVNFHQEPLDTIYVPGYDRPTSQQQGIRNLRPANPKWDFLGMAAGETVWIYASADPGNPVSSWASLGYQTTPANLSPNLTFRLQGVAGPAGGVFSMYSGTTPNIHFNTSNGIGSEDVFVKGGAHTHVNWAFSKPGLWIVSMTVEGTVAATGNPTAVSAPQPLVFAIGGFARWQAERFTIAQLQDPSFSSDAADPDGDGFSNVLEYALGGNPKVASMKRESDALPLAPELLPPNGPGDRWKFRYLRRIAGQEADLTPSVQINEGGLGTETWAGPIGTEQAEFLHDDWERVTLTLHPITGTAPVFLRLCVTHP